MSTVTDLESYQQFAQEQQAQNNAWSAQQAQKQMDFQREMSNSAHQREVADLKAAGLNPILSVNSGASVPQGASGDTDTSVAGNVGGILQQVLSAQSAREVAGMYNAATIAAATIAANASMYGADVAAQTQREYPNSIAGILSRVIREIQYEGANNTGPVGAILNYVTSGSGLSHTTGSTDSKKTVGSHTKAPAISPYFGFSKDQKFQHWLDRTCGVNGLKQMWFGSTKKLTMEMIYSAWRVNPNLSPAYVRKLLGLK